MVNVLHRVLTIIKILGTMASFQTYHHFLDIVENQTDYTLLFFSTRE